MARERRARTDPVTREEKQRKRHSSSKDEEEDDLYDKEPRAKTKTPSKPKKQSLTKPAVTPKTSSTYKKNKKDVSVLSPSDDDEESLSDDDLSVVDKAHLRESPSKSPTNSRESPTNSRQTASAAQQIADLKAKYMTETMAHSRNEKKLLEEKRKLLADLEKAKQEKKEMEEELKATAKHQINLRKKYTNVLAKVGARTSSAKSKNGGMIMQIKSVTKKSIWRIVKFIGNDQVLRKVAKMALNELKIEDYQHLEGESTQRQIEVDTAIDEWLALYSTEVRTAINGIRSYVQSEMKNIVFTWLKQGNTLPPFEEFYEIAAFRNVWDGDGNEDPKKLQLFDLYLTMLSAVAGSDNYGSKARRLVPVSQVVDANGKVQVTPSTEALCLLMYDNCYDKWMAMHKWKEVDKNQGDFPKYSSKKHEETKKWKAKYSDPCTGNSPYGGWGTEGIKKFNMIQADVREQRSETNEQFSQVEKDAMNRFAALYQADRKRKRAEKGLSEEEDSEPGKKKQVEEEEDVIAVIDEDE